VCPKGGIPLSDNRFKYHWQMCEVSDVTKIVHRPIDVQSWREGNPYSFRDGNALHIIEDVIDKWIEMGEWWNDEGSRTILRVLTLEQDLYDLECSELNWFIYRVWD
jgi:hypothetical protein